MPFIWSLGERMQTGRQSRKKRERPLGLEGLGLEGLENGWMYIKDVEPIVPVLKPRNLAAVYRAFEKFLPSQHENRKDMMVAALLSSLQVQETLQELQQRPLHSVHDLSRAL